MPTCQHIRLARRLLCRSMSVKFARKAQGHAGLQGTQTWRLRAISIRLILRHFHCISKLVTLRTHAVEPSDTTHQQQHVHISLTDRIVQQSYYSYNSTYYGLRVVYGLSMVGILVS